jgi:endogenous inhibitor of DNA gyrase (YacG/DUF329 family)
VGTDERDRGTAAPRTGRKCPICSKESLPRYRPFCSKRCADIDLHRWLGGVYRVPGTDIEVPPSPPSDDES